MKQHFNLSESADDSAKRRFARKRPEDAAVNMPRKPRARPRLAVTVQEGLDIQSDSFIVDDGAWAIEPQEPVGAPDQEPLLEIDFTQPWVTTTVAPDAHAAPAPASQGVWEVLDDGTALIEPAPEPVAAADVFADAVDELVVEAATWIDTDDDPAAPAHPGTSPVRRRRIDKTPAAPTPAAPRQPDVKPPARAKRPTSTAGPVVQTQPTDDGQTQTDLALERAREEAARAASARKEAAAAKAEAQRLKVEARLAREQAEQAQLARAEAAAARAEADRLRAEADAAKADAERVKMASAQAERATQREIKAEAKRLRDAADAARTHAQEASAVLEQAAQMKAEAARLKQEAEAARAQAQEAKLAAEEMVKAAQAEAANARSVAKAEAKAAARAVRIEATRAKAAADEERAAAIRAKSEADAVKAQADAALAAAEALVAQAASAPVEREVIIERVIERPRGRRGRASSRARLGSASILDLTPIDQVSFEPVGAIDADGDEPEWPRIGEYEDPEELLPAADASQDPSTRSCMDDPTKKATYRSGMLPKVDPRPSAPFTPYQAGYKTASPPAEAVV